MKWPDYLALVRHDVSAYNELKNIKITHGEYQKFLELFEKDPKAPETIELARKMWQVLRSNEGDHNTPLANEGVQAKKVGEKLKETLDLPDVIFVSPYERTKHTLQQLINGWPELAGVKVYEEERIREQEHGLAVLYNDWRILQTLHPEQKDLYEIEGRYWYRHPQGENVPDVRERIRSWTNTLVRDWSGKKVLAVTHHLTILSIRANLERLSAEEFLNIDEEEKPINCGVSLYRGDSEKGNNGKLILEYYNKKLYQGKR